MAAATTILEEALALEPKERARLAAKLIESLDDGEGGEEEVETLWRAEVARRVHELDEGTVETVEWQDARRQILS